MEESGATPPAERLPLRRAILDAMIQRGASLESAAQGLAMLSDHLAQAAILLYKTGCPTVETAFR